MFDIFSSQHIWYLVVFALITAGAIILSRFLIKKNAKLARILIIIMAVVTFGFMLANKIEIWLKYDKNFEVFVPGSFCSALAFWGPLIMIIFKPKSKIFQFGMFGMALGGLLTTIYPAFLIGKPTIFSAVNFTGIVYHTLMLLCFIYAIAIGYYKPSMKNWSSFALGLALMVPYILFNTQVLGGSEDMYLYAPALEGTSLYWWMIGIIAVALYTIFLLIYEQFAFKKEDRWLNSTFAKIKKLFKPKTKELK